MTNLAQHIHHLFQARASVATACLMTLLGLGMSVMTAVPAQATPDYADSFVKVSGTQFSLAGQPYRFVGANMYDAAGSYATGQFGCGPTYTDAELNASFAAIHDQAGGGVVRFWAFQSYTKGGTDFSQIDRVISIARAHNLKVLPVLENQYGDCTTANYNKDTSWYASGYASPYGGYALSYPAYVRAIVTHYKDNPTIMSWMLMNEAAADNTTLATFANTMGALIKGIDPNHLVTLGTLADQGQQGESSANDIYALYNSPNLDYVDAHDYNFDASALPRSVYDQGGVVPDSSDCLNSIACDLSVALNRLHKPLLIGEAGILSSTSASDETTRANEFRAKISAMWQYGGAGYLIWSYSPSEPTNDDFTLGDPLMAVLRSFASPVDTSSGSTPAPTAIPTSTPAPAALIGDINGDKLVNAIDLSILISSWGKSGSAADLNKDGTVNVVDLSILLAHWSS